MSTPAACAKWRALHKEMAFCRHQRRPPTPHDRRENHTTTTICRPDMGTASRYQLAYSSSDRLKFKFVHQILVASQVLYIGLNAIGFSYRHCIRRLLLNIGNAVLRQFKYICNNKNIKQVVTGTSFNSRLRYYMY